MHRRAVLAVDALQSKMQACQDEKEFLALLITYENVYSHMNDTTTNSENLLLSHKHKWIFNFVTKIEIYLKESLQEIYEFRHFSFFFFFQVCPCRTGDECFRHTRELLVSSEHVRARVGRRMADVVFGQCLLCICVERWGPRRPCRP